MTKQTTKKATVYSPVKLSSKELDVIRSYIKQKHNIDIELENKIDKSLIAGFKVVYRDLEIDLSISGQLDRLAKELMQ